MGQCPVCCTQSVGGDTEDGPGEVVSEPQLDMGDQGHPRRAQEALCGGEEASLAGEWQEPGPAGFVCSCGKASLHGLRLHV